MQMNRYYSLKNILAKNAQYNMIFGERSSGKTYAILKYGLENYVKTGKQMAYLRRYQEDFKGKRGQQLFAALLANDEIRKLTKGEYTGVSYYASKWYLSYVDENTGKVIKDENPFCFAFELGAQEHDKSISFPNITTIFFDEFLSRTTYLTDEFVLFCNVISTIVRHRDDVKIFMAGNTVNKYCPYFKEMGLTEIKTMQEGKIDVYTYGESNLKVAVEYANPSKRGKPSDVYFAFKNPKLQMITGGKWEIGIYPHCPVKYTPNEIIFTYFIYFDGDLLQADIIAHDDMRFTFIHRKTGAIKNPETDLIYSPEISARPNWVRRITKPRTEKEKKIAEFFVKEKVFYQSNDIGEIVMNYLKWCGSAA